MSQTREGYADCWTPIESNPELFTQLAQSLGLAKSLTFQDIWTLDADSTSFLPRPVHALVLVYPTDDDYEQNRMTRGKQPATCHSNHVIWFKQTIYNACGLYGLLHAVCNGEARNHIMPGTLLADILSSYSVTQPAERPNLLSTPRMKSEYLKAAQDGDSSVPVNAEDEVDFHYTCFVKSNGHLIELDGDLSGPVDLGVLKDDEDVVSETALVLVRRFMQEIGRGSIGFSILALTPTDESAAPYC